MEPVSTVMIWRRIAGEPVVRTYVPLSRISPSLQLAVIIAEDAVLPIQGTNRPA